VYVVKADDTAEIRDVKPGPTEGETASVAEGLSPGEVVVTDGVDKLVPGSKVVVRRPEGAATRSATQSSTRSATQPATQASTRPTTQAGSQPARRERP
jgi:multidrug efflux system membrane fusion protein